MNSLKAIIFDVDGTLANTEEAHRIAFNSSFKEHGLDWQWSVELYTKLLKVTGGKERMRYYVTDFLNREVTEQDDDLIAKMHLRKNDLYHEMLAQKQVPLRPGIARLINEARQKNIILAIATTTSPSNVTSLLENTLGKESISWFKVIGAGDVIKHKKPAPDIYEYVIKELNLPVAECIAMEDSYNGVISSTAINLPTLVTVNNYTANDSFDGALAVLDQLGEPGSACSVISGDVRIGEYVDIDCLNNLLPQS